MNVNITIKAEVSDSNTNKLKKPVTASVIARVLKKAGITVAASRIRIAEEQAPLYQKVEYLGVYTAYIDLKSSGEFEFRIWVVKKPLASTD